MVIGLDEIVGNIALGLTGLLQALIEKGVATIKLLCERLHYKNKKYMYFLKFNFQSGYGSYVKLLTKYDTLPSCC